MPEAQARAPSGAFSTLTLWSLLLLGCSPCDGDPSSVCKVLRVDGAALQFQGEHSQAFQDGIVLAAPGLSKGDVSPLVVAMPLESQVPGDYSAEGTVYVIYDPHESSTNSLPLLDVQPGSKQAAIIEGQSYRGNFGYSVADVGDVNGDEVGDILIGSASNQAFLYFGPIFGSLTNEDADVTFTGESGADFAGAEVSSAGDFNGDGIMDIAIGASQSNRDGVVGRGSVYIIPGMTAWPREYPLASAPIAFVGPEAEEGLGTTLAFAGDINGDSFDDLLIGANKSSTGGLTNRGRVFLVKGGNHYEGTVSLDDETVQFLGHNSRDYAGGYLAGNFDFDGDGHLDVLIGAQGYYQGDSSRRSGAAFLISGQNLPSEPLDLADASLIFLGENNGDLAAVVGVAGDLNNDGKDEIIVGAPGRQGWAAPPNAVPEKVGAAYVQYGFSGLHGLHLLADANITVYGVNAYDAAGHSVTGGVDLTGDNVCDVVITAENGEIAMQDAISDVGVAAVFSGASQLSLTRSDEWIFEGSSSLD